MSLLTLPYELRKQVYLLLLGPPLLAYLGEKGLNFKPFFTIEGRHLDEPRSKFPDPTPDLRLMQVCHQMHDEIQALLGKIMALDLHLYDSKVTGVDKVIKEVAPRWYVESVQVVRCWRDSEAVKINLGSFPNLQKVLLRDQIQEPLGKIMGKPKWNQADVEDPEIMAAVKARALELFEEDASWLDKHLPRRAFKTVRQIKFGCWRVTLPGRHTVGIRTGTMRTFFGHTLDVTISEGGTEVTKVDVDLAQSFRELQKFDFEEQSWFHGGGG